MTKRSAFFGWLLATAASISHAGSPEAKHLHSCVGSEYMQLKPDPVARGDSASVCLKQASMTVCQRQLRDDDKDTSEITVSSKDAVIVQWREQGDPAYIGKLWAFKSKPQNPNVLVIAALQSESQGMGVQGWSVNVVHLVNSVEVTRRTLTTADFGVNGSLLRANDRATAGACHLLATHWEERETKQGKRLFLVGELVSLLEAQSKSDQPNAFARRLDRRLAKLRLSDRADRPLAFFQK